MKEHTAEEVSQYLQKLALTTRLADCQFQQAVCAMRNLFVLIQCDVQHRNVWENWITDATTLKPEQINELMGHP